MSDDANVSGVVALARITDHERVCAERYEGIHKRLWRMEAFIIMALIVLVGQGWLAYTMLHPPAVAEAATIYHR